LPVILEKSEHLFWLEEPNAFFAELERLYLMAEKEAARWSEHVEQY
jgi:hypothetical protein